MGMIGRWIDEKCKTHPDVMRRVLGRKFGHLSQFIQLDDDKCGCLIGSWGIESGTRTAWEHPYRPALLTEEYVVGCRVMSLTNWRRPDALVIRFLKQRIRKSLGLAPASRDTVVAAPGGELK